MQSSADVKFLDKSAKVVVVDPAPTSRTILVQVIKSYGFTDVQGVPAVKDVLPMLEMEPLDWLVTPLQADQEVNALQILKLVMNHPAYRCLRMTLLIEETEKHYLPLAFELGLLSFLNKPFNQESVRKEFDQLFNTYKAHDWNSAFTSADYLRSYLIQAKKHGALLRLEEEFVDISLGRGDVLLNLAQAQALSDKKAASSMSLRQACLMNPALESRAKEMAKKFLCDENACATSVDGQAVNVLGIESWWDPLESTCRHASLSIL